MSHTDHTPSATFDTGSTPSTMPLNLGSWAWQIFESDGVVCEHSLLLIVCLKLSDSVSGQDNNKSHGQLPWATKKSALEVSLLFLDGNFMT